MLRLDRAWRENGDLGHHLRRRLRGLIKPTGGVRRELGGEVRHNIGLDIWGQLAEQEEHSVSRDYNRHARRARGEGGR